MVASVPPFLNLPKPPSKASIKIPFHLPVVAIGAPTGAIDGLQEGWVDAVSPPFNDGDCEKPHESDFQWADSMASLLENAMSWFLLYQIFQDRRCQ
jgi:hypothetical protein